MRITINHALDILESNRSQWSAEHAEELTRVVRRVQNDYIEIIENALSLLVQNRNPECLDYLREERTKLEDTKERIGVLIAAEIWEDEFHMLAIEYLYSRARLVDEIRLFPDFALELLDRMTLDQTLAETIAYLESAMTGKQELFNSLLESAEK